MVGKGGERKRVKIGEKFRSPHEDWQRPKLNGEVEMDVGNPCGKFNMAETWYNSVMFMALLLEPGTLPGIKDKLDKYCLKGEEGSSLPL